MLIDGTGKTFYKSRGDPLLWDFLKEELTMDSKYHGMDLSDIIGKGAGNVKIRVRMQHSESGDNSATFRKKGNTNELCATLIRAPIAEQSYDFYFEVENNSDGEIEYNISDAETWNIFRIVVQSWRKQ